MRSAGLRAPFLVVASLAITWSLRRRRGLAARSSCGHQSCCWDRRPWLLLCDRRRSAGRPSARSAARSSRLRRAATGPRRSVPRSPSPARRSERRSPSPTRARPRLRRSARSPRSSAARWSSSASPRGSRSTGLSSRCILIGKADEPRSSRSASANESRLRAGGRRAARGGGRRRGPAAWAVDLPDDVAVLILTPQAAAALDERSARAADLL